MNILKFHFITSFALFCYLEERSFYSSGIRFIWENKYFFFPDGSVPMDSCFFLSMESSPFGFYPDFKLSGRRNSFKEVLLCQWTVPPPTIDFVVVRYPTTSQD
jgi:hypothetical protein